MKPLVPENSRTLSVVVFAIGENVTSQSLMNVSFIQ